MTILTLIYQFAMRHEAIALIAAGAIVSSMPGVLPPPFDRVPFFVWWYSWLHDAAKLFWNARNPQITAKPTPPPPDPKLPN